VWKPEWGHRSVLVGFMVRKVAPLQVFSPSITVVLFQYHLIIVAYSYVNHLQLTVCNPSSWQAMPSHALHPPVGRVATLCVCWYKNCQLHIKFYIRSLKSKGGSIFKTGLLLMQTDLISSYCTKLSCALLHVSATYYSCHQEAIIKNTSNISYVSEYPFADIHTLLVSL
jgi:hypothetical protein